MLEFLKQAVYEANMELPRRGLVTYTWGNVSGIDREKGLVVIKPSGVSYEDLTPGKLVVISLDGKVVEGNLNPSSDTKTHLVLYKAFPELGGIVHTHSPHAVGWAQAGRDIPCYGTTHADYFHGPVPCARSLTPEEVNAGYEHNTGVVIVETFQTRNINPVHVPGVICRNHGPFAWGKDAAQAVYHAGGCAGGGRPHGPLHRAGRPRRRPRARACAGEALPAQARPQRLLRAAVNAKKTPRPRRALARGRRGFLRYSAVRGTRARSGTRSSRRASCSKRKPRSSLTPKYSSTCAVSGAFLRGDLEGIRHRPAPARGRAPVFQGEDCCPLGP